jgi:hypothetical protein
MAEINHGTITLTIPDELAPPAQAGKMTAKDIKKIPKAPKGVGQLCHQAADAMGRAGAAFAPPPGVTVDSLRQVGTRADGIDQYIIDSEVVQEILRQSNLLFDADAWKQLRQVNDQIKAQMKHNPALAVIFQQVLEAFARSASTVPAEPVEAPEPTKPA